MVEKPAEMPVENAEKPAAEIAPAPEPETPEQWVTLGSADPKDPYRMLVTLSSKGAAVTRIELNSPRYCDIDNRSGYLGHLVMDSTAPADGCLVQVVGPGTPAAEAGLKPGDRIKSIKGIPVNNRRSLEDVLAKKTKPNQTVEIVVVRDGEEQTLKPKLRRRPLEVIQPEDDSPLSMLFTLQQFDREKLADPPKKEDEKKDEGEQDKKKLADEAERLYNAFIGEELKGVKLRTANWKLLASDQSQAQFRCELPEKKLEITKTYTLAKVPEESLSNGDFPAYHLEFAVEIRNVGEKTRKVAYRLDGPNGLPTEGKWYVTRVTRSGGSGLRDFIISFGGGTPDVTGATPLSSSTTPLVRPDTLPDKLLTFIGVDAQYFSAVLMPQRSDPSDVWFEGLLPIRLGKVDPKRPQLTNSSCRLISTATDLKPGDVLSHQFKIFAGPKKPAILQNKEYRLGEVLYFGWPIFAMVAEILTVLLHTFYAVVHNYGLAIIMLTAVVRLLMFPLSRKQAISQQKMQQLQPEIKKLQEKHKNNPEARNKAQQELFRRHNYNPLSGCLPIFIQLPVFLGLWKALQGAIELRDAPLFSPSIRWCSNLSAPDMLFDWSSFMPTFVTEGPGFLFLGPYFNLLPILTIVLIIWQQKMVMPPAADEQAATQQKIMQYMMILMGLLFYKVGSGLCIYLVASSIWGMAERRYLPKTAPAASGNMETRAQAKARARQEAQAAAKGKKDGK